MKLPKSTLPVLIYEDKLVLYATDPSSLAELSLGQLVILKNYVGAQFVGSTSWAFTVPIYATIPSDRCHPGE